MITAIINGRSLSQVCFCSVVCALPSAGVWATANKVGLQNLCWGFESFCPCHKSRFRKEPARFVYVRWINLKRTSAPEQALFYTIFVSMSILRQQIMSFVSKSIQPIYPFTIKAMSMIWNMIHISNIVKSMKQTLCEIKISKGMDILLFEWEIENWIFCQLCEYLIRLLRLQKILFA